MMLAGAFYFLKPKYGKKGICGCWAATRGARGDIALFFFNGNTTLYTILPVKNPPAIQETQVQSLGQEDPLEKGMATHSSILAWNSPGHGQRSPVDYSMESILQFMGWQRVRHN